ncbi:MAG: serine/threonine-protein kinase [Gammaproteobacteria bacterium]|nr:MAG: serine/threonine-protein kinase [Gammaproteobacteria bacterium]
MINRSGKDIIRLPSTPKNLYQQVEIERQPLGAGSYGSVFKGISNNEIVAIKIMYRAPEGVEGLQKEIDLMGRLTKLNAPNIVRFLNGVYDNVQHKCYVVMEYMPGTLSNFIADKKINFKQCEQVTAQLAKALDFLHRINIVHCDVKPDNILAKQQNNGKINIKLCDFGLATKMGTMQYVNGTPEYLAPELLIGLGLGEKLPAEYSRDIWALGRVACDMGYVRLNSDGVVSLHGVDGGRFASLIGKCLDFNSTTRITAKKLNENMERMEVDSFFTELLNKEYHPLLTPEQINEYKFQKDDLYIAFLEALKTIKSPEDKIKLAEKAISVDANGNPDTALSQLFHAKRGLFASKTVKKIRKKLEEIEMNYLFNRLAENKADDKLLTRAIKYKDDMYKQLLKSELMGQQKSRELFEKALGIKSKDNQHPKNSQLYRVFYAKRGFFAPSKPGEIKEVMEHRGLLLPTQ